MDPTLAVRKLVGSAGYRIPATRSSPICPSSVLPIPLGWDLSQIAGLVNMYVSVPVLARRRGPQCGSVPIEVLRRYATDGVSIGSD